MMAGPSAIINARSAFKIAWRSSAPYGPKALSRVQKQSSPPIKNGRFFLSLPLFGERNPAANSCLLGDAARRQRPCRTFAEDPGRTQPRAAYPGAAAQTRVVSMAAIRLGSWESARAFKGIICDDISEIAVGTLITERPPQSGRVEARIGLRMMPTFPRPSLSFRTAGFPRYGWKAGM